MIRLLCLGSLELTGDDGRPVLSVLSQPKRAALLAYLAFGGTGEFHRRDTLLALFWPELDEARARNSLNTSVSYLRRALGRRVVVSRGDAELGLAGDLVLCDVAEFDAAIRAGDRRRALELYRGGLLPGFFVSGAPEVERWLDTERARLRTTATAAAIELAQQPDVTPTEATAAARRAVELEPTNERASRALMTALDRDGRRGEAVEEMERLRRRLAEAIEVEPSPETVALARTIAESRGPPRATERRPPPSAGPVPHGHTASPTSGHPRRRIPAVAALMGLMAALFAGGLWSADQRRPVPLEHRVVVLPFSFQGDPSYAYIGATAAHVLSAGFDAPGLLEPVDPNAVLAATRPTPPESGVGSDDPVSLGREVAARFEAGRFLVGDAVEAGGAVRFGAAVYDANGRRLASATATAATEDEVFTALDALTADLLLGQQDDPALASGGAARTTASLPALKAYVVAEAAYRDGRFGDALVALDEALAHDPLFAGAHFRRARVANWTGNYDLVASSYEDAWALRERLPERERLLLEAGRLTREGDRAGAEQALRRVVRRYPHSAEGWGELAEIQFHSDDGSATPEEVRTAFEHVAELSPVYPGTRLHLARLAAVEGDFEGLDLLTRPALAPDASGEESMELRALRAFAIRDSVDLRRSLAELARAGDEMLVRLTFRTIGFTGEFEATRRAVALFRDPVRSPAVRALATVADGYLAAARARDPFTRLDEGARALHPRLFIIARGLLAATAGTPLDPSVIEAVRRELATVDRDHPADRRTEIPAINVLVDEPHMPALLNGLLAVRTGDLDAAEAEALRLDAGRHGARGPEAARLIRAYVARRRGEAKEALRILEVGGRGPTPIEPAGIDVFLRAELLHELGRDREALRVYGSLIHDRRYAALHFARARARHTAILEKLRTDDPDDLRMRG